VPNPKTIRATLQPPSKDYHVDDSVMKDLAIPASKSAGPFGWISTLGTKERRVFGACVGGWALDAMDVQMYSFVIPALIATWNITRAQAGALSTASLLVSAMGGWLAGWFADRYGRVRTLQIAILWFAVFTFLSGLAQNYEQLFAARALLGVGFGGEWAAGAVLLGEAVRAEHRGKALGTMQAGWAVGWGAAALLYAFFFSVLPPETAWRALFLVGIAPALMVFVIRRYVEEPPVYLESKAHLAAVGDQPSFFEIFQPPLLRITFLGGLMGTGAQGGYFAVTTWLPTFLRTERKLSVLDSAGYLAVLIGGSFCGYLSAGYLADRIGRRMTFLVFAIGAGLVAVTYTTFPFSDRAMLVLGFPLGFLASGVFSAMGPFFTEHFPTRVRGVGQGFTYNVGRATGALFPTLVGILSAKMALGHAIGLFAGIAYATMAVAAFLLPETKGKVLTA
jgi:MFS family permease